MMIKGILPWRRLVETLQAVLILGLPFLKINDESALRFDIPSLRLYVFGISLWMEEFFIVVVAIIFLTLLAVLITLLFGRIWCGWLCPQTVIVDFTHIVDKALPNRRNYKLSSHIVTFVVSVVVAVSLIWYFVSPYEFFGRLLAWKLDNIIWGFWSVLTVILFLNFTFLGQRFCATVCPYAKMQSVLYDDKTLIIAFDPERREECMDCMACVRTCPVAIDVRKGLHGACINCAECLDQCTEMTVRTGKKSLIGYSFGLPGTGGRILRQNVVMISVATAAFFAFTLYLLFSRVTVDMMAMPNQNFPPRIAAGGLAVNSYFLSLKNLSNVDVSLHFTVGREKDKALVTPDIIFLRAGEYRKVPVFVRIDIAFLKDGGIDLTAEFRKHDKLIEMTKRVPFQVPES